MKEDKSREDGFSCLGRCLVKKTQKTPYKYNGSKKPNDKHNTANNANHVHKQQVDFLLMNSLVKDTSTSITYSRNSPYRQLDMQTWFFLPAWVCLGNNSAKFGQLLSNIYSTLVEHCIKIRSTDPPPKLSRPPSPLPVSGKEVVRKISMKSLKTSATRNCQIRTPTPNPHP